MKKILFILPGVLPVPAVKGGAVENLVQMILEENEIDHRFDLSVVSDFDDNAVFEAKKFLHTYFFFIKKSRSSLIADKIFSSILPKKLKTNRGLSAIFSRYNYVKQVEKLLLKNDFDFVILENHPTLLIPFKNKMVSRKFAEKVIYHAHNEIKKVYGCGREFFKLRQFWCVSDFIANSIYTELSRLSEIVPKQKVFPNACRHRQFFKIVDNAPMKNCRRKFAINEDAFIFLFAGRLDEQKGILHLAKAFIELKNERKNFNVFFLIVGSVFFGSKQKNGFLEDLENLVKNEPSIIMSGFVPYEKLNTIYNLADCIITPSIWNDPAPMVNIEALACGKPIITTNRGGIPEYVDNRCSILLAPLNNDFIEQLKNAMMTVYSDENLRKAMSEHALKKSTQFNEKKYFEDFTNLLNDIGENHNA